jgi:tetratricopeptide (TPR) repeat protein
LKKLILIFFLFNGFFSKAGEIDSLRHILKSKKLTQKKRIDALKSLSFAYCFVNPDSGIYFARKILAIAAQTGNESTKVRGQAVLGTNFYAKQELDSASWYYKKVIAYSEKNNDLKLLSSAYNNLGLVYLDLSQLKQAMNFLQKGLEVRIKLKDKKAICEAYDNMGLVYEKVGDYTASARLHFKALHIAEQLDDAKLISYCCHNVANSFAQSKDLKRALHYYFKALKYITDTSNHYEMFLSCSNIAITYNDLNMPLKAWQYVNIAKRHASFFDKNISLEGTYLNLASIYYYANDSLLKHLLIVKDQAYDSAAKYTEISLKYGEKLHDDRLMANSHESMSEIMERKNKLELAKFHIQKALEFAERVQARDIELKVLKRLADILRHLNQPARACMYLDRYIALHEKMFNEAKSNEIISGELRYEFGKKQMADSIAHQHRIAQQNAIIKEKEFRMYLLYGGIFIVIIFSFFLYSRIKVINKQKQTIHEQKIIVEQKQKEVIDSIHYAKRIQQALLPSKKYISKVMDRFREKKDGFD